MLEPLWQWVALVAATGGKLDGTPSRDVRGISIDTRTLQPGDLFVALKDQRDGHDFVGAALDKGASVALVRRDFALDRGPLLRVDDPLKALRRLGVAARARTSARVIAVTGSVGKTGTKEALRLCLSDQGATHASEKSYNNHWGVPLTLARMPEATRFAVVEIGMSHAGEITPLSQLVRPHIAIVTTVAPVHLEFFPSEEAIADAKGEIFEGLAPGGTAILNRDSRHFERLAARAKACGAARVLSFGAHAGAEARLLEQALVADGTNVSADIDGVRLSYRVGAPGAHHVVNSLAVLAAAKAAGADLSRAAARMAALTAPAGRGARETYDVPGGRVLLIDESYNANPASVRAALAAMAMVHRSEFPRRIAVLGDMRELGPASGRLHRELAEAITGAGVDLLFASGPHMAELYAAVPPACRARHAGAAQDLRQDLLAMVAPGDVVMIKGSLGSRMGPLVDALRAHLASATRRGHTSPSGA